MAKAKPNSSRAGKPTDHSASKRFEALRDRDRELGAIVQRTALTDHIASLEKDARYLKALSMAQKARNPWWVLMQVRYVIRAVVKRYLVKK